MLLSSFLVVALAADTGGEIPALDGPPVAKEDVILSQLLLRMDRLESSVDDAIVTNHEAIYTALQTWVADGLGRLEESVIDALSSPLQTATNHQAVLVDLLREQSRSLERLSARIDGLEQHEDSVQLHGDAGPLMQRLEALVAERQETGLSIQHAGLKNVVDDVTGKLMERMNQMEGVEDALSNLMDEHHAQDELQQTKLLEMLTSVHHELTSDSSGLRALTEMLANRVRSLEDDFQVLYADRARFEVQQSKMLEEITKVRALEEDDRMWHGSHRRALVELRDLVDTVREDIAEDHQGLAKDHTQLDSEQRSRFDYVIELITGSTTGSTVTTANLTEPLRRLLDAILAQRWQSALLVRMLAAVLFLVAATLAVVTCHRRSKRAVRVVATPV